MARKQKKMLACVVCIVLMLGTSVGAAIYEGTLTVGGGGIIATGEWNDPVTSMTYRVEEMAGYYDYKYTFTVPDKDISHLILELSDDFMCDDMWDIAWTEQGELECPDIRLYEPDDPGKSNPGLPDGIYGGKFDFSGDFTVLVIEFSSLRMPVWGDFYAKDGKTDQGQIDVYAYNAGFGVDPPKDPMDPEYVPPSSTPYNNKILVPDTDIPEPATLITVLLGAGMVAGRRKKV